MTSGSPTEVDANIVISNLGAQLSNALIENAKLQAAISVLQREKYDLEQKFKDKDE